MSEATEAARAAETVPEAADVRPKPDRPALRALRALPVPSLTALPRRAQRAVPIVIAAIAGLLGAWLGLMVAGTTPTTAGPLGVDVGLRPALAGDTVVGIDPIGTLLVNTHDAPFRVRIQVTAVDVGGIREIVADPASLSTLDDTLLADLQSALIRAAIRAAVVVVLGATIAAGVIMRSWRYAVVAGAVALGAVTGSYGLAWATFDPDAAQQPQFTGLLATAPTLVGSVQDITENFDAYADQLAGIVTNVGRLYDAAVSLPTFAAADDSIRVLHVSDLHLNPAAWDVIGAVAEQYDVDVIVDTGDIADHGTAPENRYVEPISDLGHPYVYVRGNHDSILTEAAVAAQPNAIVIREGEPVEVASIRFFGAPDPRFTPDQTTRGTADADLREASERLAMQARELDPPADVILFHDPTHGELFDGAAPLVLSGHGHRRHDIVLDSGTRIMVQGSTGGAGLRALEGETPTPVTLTVLYFDPETRALQAWDEITLGGLGLTSAEIQRRLPNGPNEEAPEDEESPGADVPAQEATPPGSTGEPPADGQAPATSPAPSPATPAEQPVEPTPAG